MQRPVALSRADQLAVSHSGRNVRTGALVLSAESDVATRSGFCDRSTSCAILMAEPRRETADNGEEEHDQALAKRIQTPRRADALQRASCAHASPYHGGEQHSWIGSLRSWSRLVCIGSGAVGGAVNGDIGLVAVIGGAAASF